MNKMTLTDIMAITHGGAGHHHASPRIAIIGNSGSGKSTLATLLTKSLAPTQAQEQVLPMLDLDTIAFEPKRIAVPREADAAIADLQTFCRTNPAWVIEGCYEYLIAAALEFTPTLLFLEPGLQICLENCRQRPWEAHKYASKAAQDEKLTFLLDWVADYYVRPGAWSLAAHQALFDGYAGPKHKLTQRLDDAAKSLV